MYICNMRVLVFMVLVAGASVHSEVATQVPDGYIVNSIAGQAYKVMYQAQNWVHARDECENNGGFLAVPKSQDEFDFLQKLVRGMSYPQITGTRYKLLVWLGIHNIDDHTVWRNIHGEDINETGFNKWANNQVEYSADPLEPHCAGMDAMNPGLRGYWCHLRQPYICQLALVATHSTPYYYKNVNENVDHFVPK